MAVNGVGLSIVAVGGVFMYGGVTGKSPLAAMYALLHGTSPATVPQTQGITTPVAGASGDANAAVAAAVSQIGKPYGWDTPLDRNDPNPASFDCSGLLMWCYARAGVKVSHNTVSQIHELKHRSVADAQPGDAVFFGIPAAPHHVGIYVGDGVMIDAPTEGIPVGRRNIHEHDLIDHVGVFPLAASADVGSVNNTPGATTPVKALAQSLFPRYGWGPEEFPALDRLWTDESGWSPTAQNESSGAYGIPQALPPTKLPLAGRPPSLGGLSDPRTQIIWGLGYIHGRYHTPTKAEAFWQRQKALTGNGWY